MTRILRKQNECFFVKEAAKLIGVEWKLVAREESNGGPDFIVHEGRNSFGLEVCEIFSGKVSPKKGSKLKEKAVTNQKLINEIRQQYEGMEENVPLYVKFLGDVRDSNKRQIVRTLLDMNLKEKSFPYSENRVLKYDSSNLKISVRRLPDDWPRDRLYNRPDWFSVKDSVGWVEKNTRKISETIENKSHKIGLYQTNIAKEFGLKDPENCDIRLLVVSDHMWNYGQVELDKVLVNNLHKFNDVYLFTYPGKLTVLGAG